MCEKDLDQLRCHCSTTCVGRLRIVVACRFFQLLLVGSLSHWPKRTSSLTQAVHCSVLGGQINVQQDTSLDVNTPTWLFPLAVGHEDDTQTPQRHCWQECFQGRGMHELGRLRWTQTKLWNRVPYQGTGPPENSFDKSGTATSWYWRVPPWEDC